jgi:hypothetical protein
VSVLYPTAAIRELIDETVRDDALTADAKARELSLLKEDLSVMVGEIDRHLLEARKLAEAERLVQSSAMMQLRESADIRDELIRRGLATEAQMEATGYRSHEQLDAWIADRFGLEEALIGGLRQKWAELKHPRGRGGRFRDVLDHPDIGKTTAQGKVKRVLHDTTTGQHIRVFEDKPGAPPGGGPQAYETRRLAQEKRTQAAVGEQSKRAGERSDPANVLGKVSQRSLLQYLNLTKTRPTTADLHSKVDPRTGKRVWDLDRVQVHREIALNILKKRDTKGKVCADCEKIPGHAEGDREVVYMGGGYAAGKGSVQDLLVLTGEGGLLHGARPPKFENGEMVDPGDKNQTFLALDPDEIKGELPEFKEAANDDPEANYLVYEEAWHISQLVQRMAQADGVDVLVDGISDTSPDEVAKRMESFDKAGYKPTKFFYVSVPTDVAVERAINRARTAKKMSDKRYIPEQVMRAVHRDVSATVPAIMNDPRFEHAEVNVFNTEERGNPRIAATKPHGQLGEQVKDEQLWGEFTAKGQETVAGVHDDPAHAKYLQGLFTPEEKQGSTRAPAQSWGSDRASAEAAVPALQSKMTESLQALGAALGATVRGGGQPYDKNAIPDNTGIDVLIAPPKKLDEAEKKVKRKLGGSWTRVPDLVRGSVIVDHEEDLQDALAKWKAEVELRGWRLAAVENRFASIPDSGTDTGPTTAGYKDVSLQVMTDANDHFELQFHVRPMWVAKEIGGPETGGVAAHSLYKRGQRLIDEIGDSEPTPDQVQELQQLDDLQSALYGRASMETRRG